ncbi:MAG TPA: 50S ribosomal protein L15 [Candidatus Saccharimonadales bacterium]|nr:50S ribosomal protein L15 [Candidatus Saccharimonadales bacterium]
MKFNDLNLTKNKKNKRVGRGISAGGGKTAGRGTKGQGARKSGGVRPGFEGGQMPLYMRIPKLRGFKSHRPETANVYTGQLNDLKKSTVDTQTLAEAGLVEDPHQKVKIIAKGTLSKKLSVKLQGASAGAIEQIKKAGGTFEKTPQLKRPKTSTKK